MRRNCEISFINKTIRKKSPTELNMSSFLFSVARTVEEVEEAAASQRPGQRTTWLSPSSAGSMSTTCRKRTSSYGSSLTNRRRSRYAHYVMPSCRYPSALRLWFTATDSLQLFRCIWFATADLPHLIRCILWVLRFVPYWEWWLRPC